MPKKPKACTADTTKHPIAKSHGAIDGVDDPTTVQLKYIRSSGFVPWLKAKRLTGSCGDSKNTS